MQTNNISGLKVNTKRVDVYNVHALPSCSALIARPWFVLVDLCKGRHRLVSEVVSYKNNKHGKLSFVVVFFHSTTKTPRMNKYTREVERR